MLVGSDAVIRAGLPEAVKSVAAEGPLDAIDRKHAIDENLLVLRGRQREGAHGDVVSIEDKWQDRPRCWCWSART